LDAKVIPYVRFGRREIEYLDRLNMKERASKEYADF